MMTNNYLTKRALNMKRISFSNKIQRRRRRVGVLDLFLKLQLSFITTELFNRC